MTAEKNTYGQILRSSSIVGGAQAANYLIGFARVKLVAMLLGPTGIGLVGLYTSAIGLVGTVSGLGVGSSAVREIVRAYGQSDPQEAARTIIILRRVCWATGFFGWMLAVVFREPISLAMSGSSEHAGAIAVLGATLLFGAVSGGQLALLQGLRRIGDLARAEVTGAALGSVVSVAIYFVLGRRRRRPRAARRRIRHAHLLLLVCAARAGFALVTELWRNQKRCPPPARPGRRLHVGRRSCRRPRFVPPRDHRPQVRDRRSGHLSSSLGAFRHVRQFRAFRHGGRFLSAPHRDHPRPRAGGARRQ